MTEDTAETPPLAARLSELRTRHGLTLSTLAERSGVSIAHLSRIERGLRAPSNDALLRIARAYGLTVGQLVADPPAVVAVVRASPHEPDVRTRTLSGALPGLSVLRFEGAAPWRSGAVQHGGEEWLHVVSGTLMLEIEGVTERLEAGDSAHFEAERVHRLMSEGPFVFLLATTHPPLAGRPVVHPPL